jgi:hypothetical protein
VEKSLNGGQIWIGSVLMLARVSISLSCMTKVERQFAQLAGLSFISVLLTRVVSVLVSVIDCG